MAHTMLPICQIKQSTSRSRTSFLLSFAVFTFPSTVSAFAVVTILG